MIGRVHANTNDEGGAIVWELPSRCVLGVAKYLRVQTTFSSFVMAHVPFNMKGCLGEIVGSRSGKGGIKPSGPCNPAIFVLHPVNLEGNKLNLSGIWVFEATRCRRVAFAFLGFEISVFRYYSHISEWISFLLR